ncbi:MAG: hypothetical protein LBI90_08025 [Treponema sp.]|jgi:hypothetical protein|nr:hypothetical protein [Treponema sp.]
MKRLFPAKFFQNFSFERTTFKKDSFAGRRPKNCKSSCKTNRVLQEAPVSAAFFLLILSGAFLFSACPNSSNSDLEEKTILYEAPVDDQGGQYQFYTNDWLRYNSYTSSRLLPRPAGTNTDIFEIAASKLSGHEKAGYGLIFAVSEDGENGELSYYRLVITTEAVYQVEKRVFNPAAVSEEGKYTSTYFCGSSDTKGRISRLLLQGEDQRQRDAFNRIKVIRENMSEPDSEGKITGTFRIFFNDQAAASFIDTDAIPIQEDSAADPGTWNGNRMAFTTGVNNAAVGEDFPNNPVDVRYNLVWN